MIDVATIETDLLDLSKTKKKDEIYRMQIVGKHASENGTSAAQRHFKKRFPGIAESTTRGFKNRYEINLKGGDTNKKALPRYQLQTERPLMIGGLDNNVQQYLRNVADRGGSRGKLGVLRQFLYQILLRMRNPVTLPMTPITRVVIPAILMRSFTKCFCSIKDNDPPF